MDYNCYNEGVKYLKQKFGFRNVHFTEGFAKKLRRARNKKEHKEILATATNDDYIQIINSIPDDDHNSQEVLLLLGQYYYGVSVKKELYNKLISLGVTL